MARTIKIPLKMSNGKQVRNMQELIDNFDLKSVVRYFYDGRLQRWLKIRYYGEEAEKVSQLSKDDTELGRKLCEIFGVEFVEEPEAYRIPVEIADEIRCNRYIELSKYIVEKDQDTLRIWNKEDKTIKEVKEIPTSDLPSYFFPVDWDFLGKLNDSTVIYRGKDGGVVLHNIQNNKTEIACCDIKKMSKYVFFEFGSDISYYNNKLLYINDQNILQIYDANTKKQQEIYFMGRKENPITASKFLLLNDRILYLPDGGKGYSVLGESVDDYHRGNVYCFYLNDNHIEKMGSLQEGSLIKILKCNDSLYFIKTRDKGIEIMRLDFDENMKPKGMRSVYKFARKCCVQVYDPYVLLTEEGGGYIVHAFDLRNETVNQVTSRCASTTNETGSQVTSKYDSTIYVKKALGKDKWCYNTNSCYLVGQWLYVDKGDFIKRKWYRINMENLVEEVEL